MAYESPGIPKVTALRPPSTASGVSPFHLPTSVVDHSRATVEGLSPKGRRRALGRAAMGTYLAVMDPASGATTRDRLAAADGAARVAGLAQDVQRVVVEHRVSFRGLARGLPSETREVIEARVVEAVTVPPVDGATGTSPGGGGGEG